MKDKTVLAAIIGGLSTITAAYIAIQPSMKNDIVPPDQSITPHDNGNIVGDGTNDTSLGHRDNDTSSNNLSNVIPSLSGIWDTNIPGLKYQIKQDGETLYWSIPGTLEHGTSRVEGKKLFSQIGDRVNVEFYISRLDGNNRATEVRSNDPQFKELVMFRK